MKQMPKNMRHSCRTRDAEAAWVSSCRELSEWGRRRKILNRIRHIVHTASSFQVPFVVYVHNAIPNDQFLPISQRRKVLKRLKYRRWQRSGQLSFSLYDTFILSRNFSIVISR